MAETVRNFADLKQQAADPSLIRDLIASVEGCYAMMHTAAQPITKAITTSFVALADFTVLGPSNSVTPALAGGTFTLGGAAAKGRYQVWANVTVSDANESDLVYLAVHRDGVVQAGLHVEATMTATLEVFLAINGIVECPNGTEVLTLRIKGATGTTGSAWIGSWGIKRL